MKIALTGGIGTGKSFVCGKLADYGITVYDCDAAAKRLMHSDTDLQKRLSELVGQEVFPGGVLDKALLSRFIVASDANAQAVDDIVHPFVADDFISSGMEWLESAILFESRFNERVSFDKTVCVVAPLDVQLQRVMRRDSISEAKAMEWIERQMPQQQKMLLADYVIVNDGEQDVNKQIEDILDDIRP